MRRILILLCAALLAGCAAPKPAAAKHDSDFSAMTSRDLPQPADPQALSLTSHPAATEAEMAKLEQTAVADFKAVFRKLPKDFTLAVPPTGWFTPQGELKQLRAAASVPRQTFLAGFQEGKWSEISIPPDYLSTMHLPATVSKEEMACYAGLVKGRPAYLFWSDYAESALLVADQ
jgi:hypothetical protein